MMTTDTLPELPTPKYTETIRGVPCITVTEHEHLMRAYALQAIAQAAQAEVTDEQIAACVKRASTYGLPFVGLLNPGGTPSDFSKRFTVEILALRPVQVPMTDDDVDAECLTIIGHLLSRRERDRIVWRMAEAHHGITAQAKKETP